MSPRLLRIEVEHVADDFWRGKTVEELAREQSVAPVQNLSELAGDWPADDSIDEFLGFLREVRR